ncbi:hypothetical protein BD324DRAFT_617143, partial [Kockovaella imperatae]
MGKGKGAVRLSLLISLTFSSLESTVLTLPYGDWKSIWSKERACRSYISPPLHLRKGAFFSRKLHSKASLTSFDPD